jgi:hypothetical protein
MPVGAEHSVDIWLEFMFILMASPILPVPLQRHLQVGLIKIEIRSLIS